MAEKEKRRETIITSEGTVALKKVWRKQTMPHPVSIALKCKRYRANSTEKICKGKENHKSLFTEGNTVTVLCPNNDLRGKHVIIVERPACTKKVEVHTRIPSEFVAKLDEEKTENISFCVVGVGTVGAEVYYEIRLNPELEKTVWINRIFDMSVCVSTSHSQQRHLPLETHQQTQAQQGMYWFYQCPMYIPMQLDQYPCFVFPTDAL